MTHTLTPATQDAPAVPLAAERCPVCGSSLAADQDWCLRCGAAARTRLASTPRWGAPLAVLAVLIVLSVAVLTIALVRLTRPEGTVTTTQPTTTAVAPAAATPAAGATTPAAATPPASG